MKWRGAATSRQLRVNPLVNFNQLSRSGIGCRQEIFAIKGGLVSGSGGFEAPAGRSLKALEWL